MSYLPLSFPASRTRFIANISQAMLHVKARCSEYPDSSSVKRTPVPDNLVPWNVDFKDYKPSDYTSPRVLEKPIWADAEIRKVPNPPSYKFNAIDGKVDRTSFEGKYELVNGVPRNPRGRTGLEGRGLLGKWGPNHAADPIVTRWKKEKSKNFLKDAKPVLKDGKPVLEFIAIRRRDTGEWALPGGMVDAGEALPQTLMREFSEEALNSLEASEKDKKKMQKKIEKIFANGVQIYKGYVDDPRNTDNAWLETVAVNFHDEKGKYFNRIKLRAGDDAADVRWMDVDSHLKLYASHSHFLKIVCDTRNAYF